MSETGARCAVHEEPSVGTCLRCGRFFCPRCAGEPPNDDHCAECDRVVGALPFETRRERRALLVRWYVTYLAIASDPAAALRRFPREGPLGPALVFAAVAVLLHLVGLSLIALAVQIVRHGVADFAEPRLHVPTAAAYLLATLVLVGVRFALALGVLGAIGLVARSLSPRAAVRVVAYGTAYLVLATIPVVGLVAFLRGPRFLIGAAVPKGGAILRGLLGLLLVVLWLGIPYALGPLLQHSFLRLLD